MTETEIPYAVPPRPYQVVPNSTEVLVLGILSIVFCWCWGIVSVIMSIITLVLARQGERAYNANPRIYTEVSYRNLKTGKTCAIVGLCFAAVTIIGVIIYFLLFGTLFYNVFQSSEWRY